MYHRGKSEVMVGKALKDGYREKVHIMTKNPVRLVNTTEDYRTLLDEELKRYDTEYIDVYLFHGLKKESYEQKILLLELIDEAKAAKKEGLIKHIGIANGARVVGNSLAKNPFPIFIPCHRAIRTNGELGGYQGGLAMKRLLLEMEGLKISDERKIITDKMYY